MAIDYPAEGHMGLSFRRLKVTIIAEGIFFDSTADHDLFRINIKALQTAGVFNIKVKRNSDNTYRKWDGTNTVMPVLYSNIKGDEKPYGGDSEVWVIKQITFRQAGALSA